MERRFRCALVDRARLLAQDDLVPCLVLWFMGDITPMSLRLAFQMAIRK